MIECLCINAENKPKEVHPGQWLQKGFKYHITHVYYHPNQGIQGCSLKEVRLGKESAPFETYRLSRFGVTEENLEKLIQMVRDCSELNDFDIHNLIEESKLEIIK